MRYLYFIFLLIGCNSNKDNNFLEKDGNIAIPLKENSSTEGHFVEDNKDMVFSYSKMSKKLFIYDGYKVVAHNSSVFSSPAGCQTKSGRVAIATPPHGQTKVHT